MKKIKIREITDLIHELGFKNVYIEVIEKYAVYLRKQWEEKFAGTLDKYQKKKIYLYQHLWHIFSYQKIEHLNGQVAINAFNNIKKNECFVFYQDDEDALKLYNSKAIKAEDFNNENDVYVVDVNMTWTYVHTHEEDCGPYFCKISSK
jgi:hypothetical protein